MQADPTPATLQTYVLHSQGQVNCKGAVQHYARNYYYSRPAIDTVETRQGILSARTEDDHLTAPISVATYGLQLAKEVTSK